MGEADLESSNESNDMPLDEEEHKDQFFSG
jgi:hypothetical protein